MQNITESKLILSALIKNDDYFTKVFPHLKPEYFKDDDRIVFEVISDFVKTYQLIPSLEAVVIETDKKKIKQNLYQECINTIEAIYRYDITDKDLEWLINTSEKYCKDVALRLGLIKSSEILNGDSKTNLTETAIPDILLEAVSISFNQNIGHDYLEDGLERFEYYNDEDEKVPCDVQIINEITKGGFSKKKLNLFVASTSGGKSLTQCSLAASNLILGHHVLYITLEEYKYEIGRRIDANLLNIDLEKIKNLSKEEYLKNLNDVKNKTLGKLSIYEDLSGTFNVYKIKTVLDDLKLKKGFIPDIIYIDYLTLLDSIHYKKSNTTTYTYYKSVAEEVRNLIAKQHDVSVVSALQLNRSGSKNPDADLTDISESYGIAMTADWACLIDQNDELKKINQYRYKQLKSRYDDINKVPMFFLGIDKYRMRIYELDDSVSKTYNNYNEEFEATNEELLTKLKSFEF